MKDIKTYSYNEETKVLDLRTDGVLTVDDIISHYVHISNDDSLPRRLKILIDSRGTRLDLRIADIELTQDAVQNALRKYNYLKEAIIVDKPYETVLATMFERFYSKRESYSFKVFSTENAARWWLALNP